MDAKLKIAAHAGRLEKFHKALKRRIPNIARLLNMVRDILVSVRKHYCKEQLDKTITKVARKTSPYLFLTGMGLFLPSPERARRSRVRQRMTMNH
jgi:hypothetical protein